MKFEINLNHEIEEKHIRKRRTQIKNEYGNENKFVNDYKEEEIRSYYNNGVTFNYNSAYEVKHIEIEECNPNENQLIFNGINLLEKNYEEILEILEKFDDDIINDTTDIYSFKYKLNIRFKYEKDYKKTKVSYVNIYSKNEAHHIFEIDHIVEIDYTNADKYNFDTENGMEKLKIGLDKKQIRNLIGDNYETSHRINEYGGYSEYHNNHSIAIFYDRKETAQRIEFHEEIEVYVNGVSISKMKYEDIIKYLKKIDPDLYFKDGEILSVKYKIGTYKHNPIHQKMNIFTLFSEEETKALEKYFI